MFRQALSLILVTMPFIVSAGVLAPDKDVHKAFLVGEYASNKPDLIVFKDPRCPYCIKALQQIERLERYNVYMFWAPILGESSEMMVDDFFRCDTPADENLLSAVSYRKPVQCEGDFNKELFALNNQVVDTYKPNSVPQYWYGGQRVAVSQLSLSMSFEQRVAAAALRSTTKVPWDRYEEFRITESKEGWANIALVLPPNQALSNQDLDALKGAQSFMNWYVFSAPDEMQERNLEFRYLTNLPDVAQPMLVLEGKPLTQFEIEQLFSPNFLNTFDRISKACCTTAMHDTKTKNEFDLTSY